MRRLDFLLHRWIGIGLGCLVFVWFGSGVAMLYYPWPEVTGSREASLLRPFEPDSGLIGFARAHTAAFPSDSSSLAEPVGARLQLLGDRLVYQFRRDGGFGLVATAVVDARSGIRLSPLSASMAEAVARGVVGAAPAMLSVDRLVRGDRYMMNGDYAAHFPAWRVRFDDSHATAVYVSEAGGDAFGIVTRLTRFTTWTGTVPHWLYFRWLYYRDSVWNGVIVGAGSLVVVLGLTGLIWGMLHLFPRRRSGARPLSGYRGVSRWHHLSGVAFGVLVVTWAGSGVYQNLGSGSGPRREQLARVRGGRVRWDGIGLSESDAVHRLRASSEPASMPVAIDLVQVNGRPGFEVHFERGGRTWVDAESGDVRSGLDEGTLRSLAQHAVGDSLPIARFERITSPDAYYYARHGREVSLPVWRAELGDHDHSRLYLDPVSGAPLAFVDAAARRARWLRDALHSFDIPALNNHRPLWDIVILPLLLGGLLLSGSGVILLLRRLRRVGAGLR